MHVHTCVRAHICAYSIQYEYIVNTNHGVNTKEGLPCVRLSVASEDDAHHPCSQLRKLCGEVVLFVHGTPLELQSRELCAGPDRRTGPVWLGVGHPLRGK